MFDFTDFEEWLFWQEEKSRQKQERENFENLCYIEDNE